SVEVPEQRLRILGDVEEPLLQEALLDLGVGVPLAVAIDHLLVGDHAHVLGTPVDRRLLAERQARGEQLQENPVRPLVVAGVGGGELVPPVEHAAEAPQLAAEGLDVLRDQLRRVGPHRERVVLRVDAERVEPDRLEHVVPLQPLEPPVDVGAGEREHVPHVQALGRGIGEHHEVVERPARSVQVGLVGVLPHPALLPLGLDQLRIVGRDLSLRERRREAEALAGAPAVVRAALEASQAAVRQRLPQLDIPTLERMFNQPRELGGDPDLAAYLRGYGQHSDFAEVFFTESHGYNVLASDRTSDFVQSDEGWWQQAVKTGAYEGPPRYDSSAATVSLEYDIAIRAPRVARPVGVLKAVFALDRLSRLLAAADL